jgi:hypothetical protein
MCIPTEIEGMNISNNRRDYLRPKLQLRTELALETPVSNKFSFLRFSLKCLLDAPVFERKIRRST